MAWKNYNPGSKSKYRSTKVEIDGIKFDSLKEGRRYSELKLLEKQGEISNLELQKKFILIPAQRGPDTIGPRGGIKQGPLLERECAYYADFAYTDNTTGEMVIEDTKSPITRTTEYRIKRKLMLYNYGIQIKEL